MGEDISGPGYIHSLQKCKYHSHPYKIFFGHLTPRTFRFLNFSLIFFFSSLSIKNTVTKITDAKHVKINIPILDYRESKLNQEQKKLI